MVDLRPAQFALPQWDPDLPNLILWVNLIFPMLEDGLLNETPQWAYLFAYLTQIWLKTCLPVHSYFLQEIDLSPPKNSIIYNNAANYAGFQLSHVQIQITELPDDQDVYFGQPEILHCGWFSWGVAEPPRLNHPVPFQMEAGPPYFMKLEYVNFINCFFKAPCNNPSVSCFFLKLKPGVAATIKVSGMEIGEGVGYASNVGGTLIEANPLYSQADGQVFPYIDPLRKPPWV